MRWPGIYRPALFELKEIKYEKNIYHYVIDPDVDMGWPPTESKRPEH